MFVWLNVEDRPTMPFLRVREASTWGWLAQWLVVFVDHTLVIIVDSILSKKRLGVWDFWNELRLSLLAKLTLPLSRGCHGGWIFGLERFGCTKNARPKFLAWMFPMFSICVLSDARIGKFGKWALLVHFTFPWSFTKKIEPVCNFMQLVLCRNISFNHSTQAPLTVGSGNLEHVHDGDEISSLQVKSSWRECEDRHQLVIAQKR